MKHSFSIHELKIEGYTEPLDISEYILDRYVYAFLSEGEALADIDGLNYLIGPGQFIIVPESKRILIKHYNNCYGFIGSFSISFLKDASYSILRTSKPHLQSFWFDDAVFLGHLFKRMLTAMEDKDYTFLQSAMDMILCQVRPGGKVAAIPEKFLQLVFEGRNAQFSVSEYAAQLNVTPNYLNKTVKQHTHRTAIDWIEIARLNMAKALLKDPTVPIGEIAGRVGVPDQSYFARFFKKKTGVTPSEFRNQ